MPLRDVKRLDDTQRWLQGIDRTLLGIVEALSMLGERQARMEGKLDTTLTSVIIIAKHLSGLTAEDKADE